MAPLDQCLAQEFGAVVHAQYVRQPPLGRPGYEDQPYPQADIFRKALRAVAGVLTQPLIDAGLQGEAIGRELHKLRVQAIEDLT